MGIHIVQESGFVRYTAAGAWAPEQEAGGARADIRRLDVWHPAGRVLVDIRDIDVSSVPTWSDGLHDRLEGWRVLGPPPRIAVLATPGVRFGLGRVLEQFIGGEASQTFADEHEALAWLLAPEPTPGRAKG